MKLITNLILSLACSASLAAFPARASSEHSPTPTPSPTPQEEPSATPEPGDDGGGDTGGDSGGDNGGDNGDGDNGDQGSLSLHGLYEGTTATGALAVFYVETNTHVQVNVLDVTGQQVDFAEGTLTNGSFSLTLTSGATITGQASEDSISVMLGNVPFTAAHVDSVGVGAAIGGRYVGVANNPAGQSTVMFVMDANNHIVLVQIDGTVRSGGFGTVIPPTTAGGAYTFTLNHFIGSTSAITGSFQIQDGVFSGNFTTSAGDFTVASFKDSLANHMANISTRGLVGPGQGQLIGGFIITGGPKTVLIRALGPSLTAAGVSPVVANPSLQLFAGGTLLAANDDWTTNTNAAEITAGLLAPTNPLESALLVRLEPGAYTTVLTNGDGSTAIALVEVYEMGFE